MKILVQLGGWGEGHPAYITKVLGDVAKHLCQSLRTPLEESLSVVPAPETDPHPRTLLRGSSDGPIVIRLTARDKRWAQFAYQFSHELCHVLSGYEDLDRDPNNWFHEAVCELASMFTLRRMAEGWPATAPLPNWADHSVSPGEYAEGEDLKYKREKQLLPGATLASWVASHEEELKDDCEQRAKNAIVARALLPLFESEPSGWNAVRCFPTSESPLKDYLNEWSSAVKDPDRPFVERIIQLFEE